MPKPVIVQIDKLGQIHPDQSEPCVLPEGEALLTWPEEEDTFHLSESALAEDWLRPEEDAAWAHLQPDK